MKTILQLAFILLFTSSVFAQRIVEHVGIATSTLDLSSLTTIAQATINPTEAGKVIVRFDGYCNSSPGDLIVLAASNSTGWGPNDGNVGVEAIDADLNASSFSHTRVYNVSAGSHTYYAVAQNYVETDGTGFANIYGSLTVEFVPNTAGIVEHVGIAETNIDLNSETILGQLTINPTEAGKVILRFDGLCAQDVGDRIVLAASEDGTWNANNGNINLEVPNSDNNYNSFSHTIVQDVTAGANTFYAVGHNWVETAGSGIASVYGSLTAQFIPASSSTFVEDADVESINTDFTNTTTVGTVSLAHAGTAGKVIVNFNGNCVSDPGDRIIVAASNSTSWSSNDGQVGVEAVDADVNRRPFSHTRVYDVSAGTDMFYAVGQNWVETDGDGEASIYGKLTAQFIPNPSSVGVIEADLNVNLKLYPNPSEGTFTLTLNDLDADAIVEVLDVAGRVVYNLPVKASAGFSKTIDSQLTSGTYLLSVTTEKGKAVRKLQIK